MNLRGVAVWSLAMVGCGGGGKDVADLQPVDPSTAPRVVVDRFSEAAATIFVRTDTNGLPGPGDPIDFDAMFVTQGLGPNGEVMKYYSLDQQPREPALMYLFFYEDARDEFVAEQLAIVDVIPGDADYNDFWWITKVYVPRDYRPNGITDVRQIAEYGLETELIDRIENCAMVPEGSTAMMRLTPEEIVETVPAWYRGQIAHFLLFGETSLSVTAEDLVPVVGLYVTFMTNGDPTSGFVTEDGVQTHNVAAAIPPDPEYSPLWTINVYDNAAFDTVVDETSAKAAPLLGEDVALVNCPVVSVTP